METFKLGSSKKKISMPSGWHEVPFYKGLQIMEGGLSDIEIMGLLSDTDPEEIKNTTDSESIYYLMGAFLFLQDMPKGLEHPKMPQSIKIDDRYVIFPHVIYQDEFDLGKSSVGQIKDMEMVMLNMGTQFLANDEDNEEEEQKENRPFTQLETVKMCPKLCAIYIQKLIDKKYDYDTAMKLSEKLERSMSFKEMINIGYFFLLRLSAFKNGQKKGYQKRPLIPRKLTRGFMNLIRRMDLILR